MQAHKIKSIEKRTIESSIAGLVLTLLSFAQSIFLVPLFLKYWGAEKYALMILVVAFLNLLRTFDLGHQNYVGFEFNRLFHLDKEDAKHVLGSGFRMCFFIGLIELCFFLFIYIRGDSDKFIGGNVIHQPFMIWAMIFMLIYWWLWGSIGGLLVRVMLPIGRYAQSTYFSIISKVAELLLLLVTCYMNLALSIYFSLLALISILYTMCVFIYVKQVLPEFYPWWQHGNLKTGVKNLFKSISLTINNFIDQFNTNNGIFLSISHFLGSSNLPIFTTQKTVVNVFSQLTGLFLQPVTPDIIRFHALGEFKKIMEVFKVNWLFTTFIVNVPLVLLIPFINSLYNIWTLNKLIFNINLFYLLAISVSIVNYGKPFVTYLSGINSLRALMVISIVKSIVLFAILIPMLLYTSYQWESIGFSIAFCELIGSAVLPAYFFKKQLNEQKILDWVIGFLPTVVLTSVCFLCFLKSDWSVYFVILGVLILTMLIFLQWQETSIEVKTKFYNLFPVIKLNKDKDDS